MEQTTTIFLALATVALIAWLAQRRDGPTINSAGITPAANMVQPAASAYLVANLPPAFQPEAQLPVSGSTFGACPCQ